MKSMKSKGLEGINWQLCLDSSNLIIQARHFFSAGLSTTLKPRTEGCNQDFMKDEFLNMKSFNLRFEKLQPSWSLISAYIPHVCSPSQSLTKVFEIEVQRQKLRLLIWINWKSNKIICFGNLGLYQCENIHKRTLHSPAPAHQVQLSVLRQLLLVSLPASRFIKVSKFNAFMQPRKSKSSPTILFPVIFQWKPILVSPLDDVVHRERNRQKTEIRSMK